eukprot:scaffold35724_cov146-Isochrysis_galbana.AAC.2
MSGSGSGSGKRSSSMKLKGPNFASRPLAPARRQLRSRARYQHTYGGSSGLGRHAAPMVHLEGVLGNL